MFYLKFTRRRTAHVVIRLRILADGAEHAQLVRLAVVLFNRDKRVTSNNSN